MQMEFIGLLRDITFKYIVLILWASVLTELSFPLDWLHSSHK